MLCKSLKSFPEIEVVGAVSTGSEAIQLTDERHPDVVLADVDLGREPNGIQVGHKIRKKHPHIGIVILSMYRDKQYISSLPEIRNRSFGGPTQGNIVISF